PCRVRAGEPGRDRAAPARAGPAAGRAAPRDPPVAAALRRGVGTDAGDAAAGAVGGGGPGARPRGVRPDELHAVHPYRRRARQGGRTLAFRHHRRPHRLTRRVVAYRLGDPGRRGPRWPRCPSPRCWIFGTSTDTIVAGGSVVRDSRE